MANELVLLCLDRILHSPAFRHSGRSRKFLEFVVHQKLAGRQDEIKERTLGTELFGRPADFDTSSDSIVRVNANEVRKRLSQYYAELDVPDPIRISLPHGSYIPELTPVPEAPPVAAFSLPVPLPEQPPLPEQAPSPEQPPSPEQLPMARTQTARRRPSLGMLALAGLAAAALGYVAWQSSRRPPPERSALERFWAPFLGGRGPVLLSLPSSRTATPRPRITKPLTPEGWAALQPDDLWFHSDWHVSLPVLQGAVAVGGLLAKMDTPAAIRLGDELQADELHSSRIVSLGSFSNAWVGRTTGGYRFIFSRGATDREAPRVVDQQDPSRRWVLNALFPAEPQTRDYAIITRTLPPLSAQPAISLAGLHSFGNFIAADFAVSESGWKAIAERAPAGWESMNLQIVLEADVVGTAVGPPRVLAAHFWR